MKIILITGISGSGKSVALNAMADLDYYCVDNLAPHLLAELVDFLYSENKHYLAVSIDARSSVSLDNLPEIIEKLRANYDIKVLFLNASTQSLIQRFSETRRRHPLSTRFKNDPQSSQHTLEKAIEFERQLMSPIQAYAHQIDTTYLSANKLRNWVKRFSGSQNSDLLLTIESFGFKHGIPISTDFLFDVRVLPNPYYESQLRNLNGLDEPVITFLNAQPLVLEMMEDIHAFLLKWLHHFKADNRSYLTIAIGCTGGQHRSVFIAEALARRFKSQVQTVTQHRDCQSIDLN